MIICISGLTGSGKTAIGKLLAKELNMRMVGTSYKNFAGDKEGLIEFLKDVKPKFAKDFDEAIVKEANTWGGVVTTWLGPWLVKNSDLNILVKASLEARAKRKAKDLGITLAEATEYVENKDSLTAKHFKEVYGIDIINDSSVFDVEINTERMKEEEEVALIAMLSLARSKKQFG